MIFGGLDPGQYAKKWIYQNGEMEEKYEIECDPDLWQEIAEEFGSHAVVLRKDHKSMAVRVNAIPSVMRVWIMSHINRCELIGPKRFRDEIQSEIMKAYKKYCT